MMDISEEKDLLRSNNNKTAKEPDKDPDANRVRPWALIGIGASITAIMFMGIPIVAGIIALIGLGFSVFGVITGVTKQHPLRGVAIAGIVVSIIVIAFAGILIMDDNTSPKNGVTTESDQPSQSDLDEDIETVSEDDLEAEPENEQKDPDELNNERETASEEAGDAPADNDLPDRSYLPDDYETVTEETRETKAEEEQPAQRETTTEHETTSEETRETKENDSTVEETSAANRLMSLEVTFAQDNDVNIGDDWERSYIVNDEYAKTEYLITEGEVLYLQSLFIEKDDDPDRGEASASYTVSEKDLSEGFVVRMELTVTENNGRYSGQTAEFTVYFTFLPR